VNGPKLRFLYAAIASAISCVLVACGFHLQGAQPLPAAMQTTFLDVTDTDTGFARALRRTLADAGTTLTPNRDDATAVLRVLQDDAGQRVLSVSPVGVPEEYELYHTIEVSLVGGGRTLLEPYTVTVTRDYRFEPTDVLGKQHEAEYLQEAMVDDLVQLVLRRLTLVR
jgi:LPS-assembly lipoprotein